MYWNYYCIYFFFTILDSRLPLMITHCCIIHTNYFNAFKMFAAHSRKNRASRDHNTAQKPKCSKIFTEPCFHKATGSDGFWVTAAAQSLTIRYIYASTRPRGGECFRLAGYIVGSSLRVYTAYSHVCKYLRPPVAASFLGITSIEV